MWSCWPFLCSVGVGVGDLQWDRGVSRPHPPGARLCWPCLLFAPHPFWTVCFGKPGSSRGGGEEHPGLELGTRKRPKRQKAQARLSELEGDWLVLISRLSPAPPASRPPGPCSSVCTGVAPEAQRASAEWATCLGPCPSSGLPHAVPDLAFLPPPSFLCIHLISSLALAVLRNQIHL